MERGQERERETLLCNYDEEKAGRNAIEWLFVAGLPVEEQ